VFELESGVFRLSEKQESEIAPRRARSKEFLIKKFSELCELWASVVILLHRKAEITKI
jgi:hypothetical protein